MLINAHDPEESDVPDDLIFDDEDEHDDGDSDNDNNGGGSSEKPPEKGKMVTVTFSLPSSARRITAMAEVAWVKAAPEGKRNGRMLQILGFHGLERVEVTEARAGDIIAFTGIEELNISDTLCDPKQVEALPPLSVTSVAIADSPLRMPSTAASSAEPSTSPSPSRSPSR